MKYIQTVAVLLATVMIASCGIAAHDHADEGHGHDHGAMVQEQDTSHNGAAVQLDNGKAWAANAETTDGIAAMQAILDSYDPAVEDSTMLKEELEAEFSEIFAKCTMTGEAHEQLHNYLKPVHAMLEKLGGSPTVAQRQELSDYLATYGKYFH